MDNHAGKFKRVEVKGKPGAPYPILYLIGKHNNIIRAGYKFKGRVETMEWLYQWLEENAGITPDSPPPEFVPEEFETTEHCLAFRALSADGQRSHEQFPFDKPCYMPVTTPHPGHCLCSNGEEQYVPYFTDRRREVFKCEDICANKIAVEEL
eukprot:TRINITY_DN1391_c1_g3_i3.p1 TRINITY_DN1391_c1_g3~~TRINITY_DN1391_c1_g3_i3.p1  ORF type:complete len:152 (+),score=18.08 TRINITY_DN1391_c1_g3_i3:202-657(+)